MNLDDNKLEAEREAHRDTLFEEARQGFLLQPKDWPELTKALFMAIESGECDIWETVARNFYDEAKIGSLLKTEMMEAWDVVVDEQGL